MQGFLVSSLALAAWVAALPQPQLSAQQVVEAGLKRIVSSREAAAMALRESPVLRARAHIYERASAIIPVVVGGSQDTYVPNVVTAAVGDVIQFQFSNGNHTVTQSNADSACQPLQATVATAIHSGHVPFQDGQTTVGTFNMPVVSTDTMWIYCATGPHCQLGQVMIINPTSTDQLPTYAKLAAQAAANVDGTNVVGGTVASIPLAQAAFVPAAPKAAPPAAPPGASSSAAAAPAPAPSSATSSAADPAATAPPASSATSSPAPAGSTTTTAAPAATTASAPPAASDSAAAQLTLPLLAPGSGLTTTLSGTTTTTLTVPPAAT